MKLDVSPPTPVAAEKQQVGTAKIEINGQSYELPVIRGTRGPDVIDISKLYKKSGYFTYDPGFTSTASCDSGLTFIDGKDGILAYRGYAIDQLAEKGSFLETCHLLLYGELPTAQQDGAFCNRITYHSVLHEQMNKFDTGFRRDAHPMAVMVGVVGALSAFYHESTDIHDAMKRRLATHQLIAKMPTIAAMVYKYSVGQPFVYPRNDLPYADNFLHMTFSVPTEDYKVKIGRASCRERV